ncbi:hypothetical protein M885DRAFT_105784 [Pelagophyceae sp. CCMP2097]|nr:hypothetical protein M885DRAFT_105784 [Pelagophyceae sp. CCMP2097]
MRFALLLCAAFARAAAPIDALVKAALEAHKAGDAKGALQLYRTVLRLDTAKEALSQKARGVVCANAAAIEVANGDFSGAEALLDCAVANDPSPKNLASRAAFYLAQDRLGPAEQACRAALKQDPAHAAVRDAVPRRGAGPLRRRHARRRGAAAGPPRRRPRRRRGAALARRRARLADIRLCRRGHLRRARLGRELGRRGDDGRRRRDTRRVAVGPGVGPGRPAATAFGSPRR